MDYGNMIGDSFEYAKEAVLDKWLKWILLIIPFMAPGYAFQIYKGTKPAPEINDWVANFINGIKLFIVGLLYGIPIIIVGAIFLLPLILGVLSLNFSAVIAGIGSVLLGLLICFILGIIIAIILPIALIRFARTDSIGEAFNVGEIFTKIGNIGWGSYIIAWIVLFIAMFIFAIIFGIISSILMIIPILGWILSFIIDLLLMPAIVIFVARYFTQVFDSAGAA
jgi:hypothetical protein